MPAGKRPDLTRAVAEVESLTDPAARAEQSHALLAALVEARTQVSHIRQAAVMALRAAGWSHQRVADLLGVSRGTAQLIAEGRSRGSRTEQGRNGDPDI